MSLFFNDSERQGSSGADWMQSLGFPVKTGGCGSSSNWNRFAGAKPQHAACGFHPAAWSVYVCNTVATLWLEEEWHLQNVITWCFRAQIEITGGRWRLATFYRSRVTADISVLSWVKTVARKKKKTMLFCYQSDTSCCRFLDLYLSSKFPLPSKWNWCSSPK